VILARVCILLRWDFSLKVGMHSVGSASSQVDQGFSVVIFCSGTFSIRQIIANCTAYLSCNPLNITSNLPPKSSPNIVVQFSPKCSSSNSEFSNIQYSSQVLHFLRLDLPHIFQLSSVYFRHIRNTITAKISGLCLDVLWPGASLLRHSTK